MLFRDLFFVSYLCKVRLERFGNSFGFDGSCNGEVDIVEKGKNLSYEFFKTGNRIAADLESGVDEEIRNVIVGCENTANKTIKLFGIVDAVCDGVDKSDLVGDFVNELCALFYTNNITGCRFDSVVNHFNKILCFARTFKSYKNLQHNSIPPENDSIVAVKYLLSSVIIVQQIM